jgi:hypothetical protein
VSRLFFTARKEIHMRRVIHSALAAGILAFSATAMAGEIKGPPPTGNLPDAPSISNGNSFCSFSGLNDTPDGLGEPGSQEYDPGGQVQSFGYFMSKADLYDPSDPDDRDNFAFPSVGCNPQHFMGRH